jgi:hypothetical protein
MLRAQDIPTLPCIAAPGASFRAPKEIQIQEYIHK